MKVNLKEVYQSILDHRAHAFAVYFTVATILLISTGGILSSITIAILIILGLLTLGFDSQARGALLDSRNLLPLMILLGGVLLWQSLGMALRDPRDAGAASVLGSAVAITMLLPVLLAATQHDPAFRNRLLKVMFVLGCIAAFVSIARYFAILGSSRHLTLKAILQTRLVPIGRANHEILGSGGLAACFFAGLPLCRTASDRRRCLILAGLLLIALTIVMTQSRGPMIGMSLAIAATAIVELLRGTRAKIGAAFILAPLCFVIPVAMVASEPWIKSLVCTSRLTVCRPSNRQDVWATVLGMIQERPWFGIGPTFRFPDGIISHPHNGILGLIFYFGFPMGLLFLAIVAFVVKRAAAAPPSPERSFALLGIFFSMSFIATDLSNPFAFLNTLYLYLWLPVFVGAIAGSLGRENSPMRAGWESTPGSPILASKKAADPC